MDISLNQFAAREVDAYLSLTFKDATFAAPYAINEFGMALAKLLSEAHVDDEKSRDVRERFAGRETAYGWFVGKATAAQLTDAIPHLLERTDIPAHVASAYGVLEIMKLYGLGVDCSGFVYNVLHAAHTARRTAEKFVGSLDWRGDEHDVTHAGTFVFAGKASLPVAPADVRPLDLLLIKSGDDYAHVGLIIERGGELRLAQSALLSEPSGVTDTPFTVRDGRSVFSIKQGLGSDWNDLAKSGALEFRRLAIHDTDHPSIELIG